MGRSASVRLEAVSRDFGATRVVDSLSLEVHPGEVVGLLGPNGAGKTTALRMLVGLLSPTAGKIELAGVDVRANPIAARRMLGFMTATTGLYERLTPRETLQTFGRLYGLSEERLFARITALEEELGIREFATKRCGTLSAGQKQRVSIARAVVHDPGVYVLDEPTAALDPLASQAILELVRGARARDKAVLFSTHRMEEAEYLCDRIAFLSQGRKVIEGSPAELRTLSGQASLHGAFLHFAANRSAA